MKKELVVRNFKCGNEVKDITLKISPITFLVGPDEEKKNAILEAAEDELGYKADSNNLNCSVFDKTSEWLVDLGFLKKDDFYNQNRYLLKLISAIVSKRFKKKIIAEILIFGILQYVVVKLTNYLTNSKED